MAPSASEWNVGRRKGVVVLAGVDTIASEALRARLERLSPAIELFRGESVADAPVLLRRIPARPALVLVDGEGAPRSELQRVLRAVHVQLVSARVPLVLLCGEGTEDLESVRLSTQVMQKPLCERKTVRLAESYLRPWLGSASAVAV